MDGDDSVKESDYINNRIGARSYSGVSWRMINNEVYVFGGAGYNAFASGGVGTITFQIGRVNG